MTDETGNAPEEERPGAGDEDAAALRDRFGEAALGVRVHCGQITVEIRSSALLETARFLRDERGFSMLSFLAGVDCLELPVPYRFKVAYALLDLDRAQRLRLEVACEDDLEPRLPSVCGVWPGAAPHESEAYDLVGIVFEGNENLERIFTPEGFEGFPHRKDFDISAEPVAFSFRDTPEGKPEASD